MIGKSGCPYPEGVNVPDLMQFISHSAKKRVEKLLTLSEKEKNKGKKKKRKRHLLKHEAG